jgi:YD repeat-containing protein
VSLSYDANFRPVSQSVNGGNTVAFGYDDDGLLTSAGALSLTRDPANGLLTGTTLGNVTTSQSYSGAGELASYEARYAGNPVFQTSYERDSQGRITAINETVQGVSTRKEYRYDPAGRLSEVYEDGTRTVLYEYDLNGNRTRFTGTTSTDTATALYDDQDRLLRYGNARYRYTANGELTEKAEGADTTRYTYDPLGNLVTVILPNHDRIDYLIDGQNRRVGKKLNGHFIKGWLYQNALSPIAEMDSTGSTIAQFIFGSKGHVPDQMIRGGMTYRLLTDRKLPRQVDS